MYQYFKMFKLVGLTIMIHVKVLEIVQGLP